MISDIIAAKTPKSGISVFKVSIFFIIIFSLTVKKCASKAAKAFQ